MHFRFIYFLLKSKKKKKLSPHIQPKSFHLYNTRDRLFRDRLGTLNIIHFISRRYLYINIY